MLRLFFQHFRPGQFPVHEAVMSEELARLENCIRRGFDQEAALASGETALHLASHVGLHRQVERLLKAGANPDARSHDRRTPLHLATVAWVIPPCCERRDHDEAARLECCRLLVEAGADVNARCARGLQCLHLVSGRQPAILEYLLDHGADVNGVDDLGATPLHHFFALGCTELEPYQMLLDYGADPARKNLEGQSIADLFALEEAEDWWGSYSDFAEKFRRIRELLGVPVTR
ncbi:MAG: ankyrin repeat domain-containing protein [Candidatus Eremiobacteraeota bacterium]|nr:ankyrin repeat domain-containing protein [Candidatus Eremiobacteraeota bacterium]MCW5869414.1 ankyrin repeat domain-containing protein [Candidatus Eremiobacteraeota bacterium]